MSRPGRLLPIFVLGATILLTLAGEPASRAEAAPQFFENCHIHAEKPFRRVSILPGDVVFESVEGYGRVSCDRPTRLEIEVSVQRRRFGPFWKTLATAKRDEDDILDLDETAEFECSEGRHTYRTHVWANRLGDLVSEGLELECGKQEGSMPPCFLPHPPVVFENRRVLSSFC
jgi:hypothetical protein